MKLWNRMIRSICITLLVVTASCSKPKSDTNDHSASSPPSSVENTSTPDDIDASDSTSSQDSSFDSETSASDLNQDSTDTVSSDSSDPTSTIPSSDSVSSINDIVPPNIMATQIAIDDLFSIKMKIGENWQEFSSRLPTGKDLRGFEAKLLSSSSLQANLKCENQDCTTSKIWVSNGEKTTFIEMQQIMFFALPGEIQRNCETPIFFDYELKDIPNVREIQENISQLSKISLVQATFSQITLWNQEKLKSVRLDLFAGKREFMTIHEDNIADRNTLPLTPNMRLSAQTVSYGAIGQHATSTIEYLKFHFQTDANSTRELCYHLPLFPEMIRW